MIERSQRAFTVIELLTVVSIIVVLTTVLGLALRPVRRYSRRVSGIHRQCEIVNAVTLYACENDSFYPPSVALCYLGGRRYRWQDPRKIKTTRPLWNMAHNSVAGYLSSYLPQAESLYCPSSPGKVDYWEEAWQAQDQWDHPQTATLGDPVFGSFCLFWNYIGYQTDSQSPFRGPSRVEGVRGQSTLLVSDYFGADEWRWRGAFGSCEPFAGAEPVDAGDYYSPYWASERQGDLDIRGSLSIRLYGGYSDGSVVSYSTEDTEVIEAAEDAYGQDPYSQNDDRWPGYFFVPRRAITETN